ncbi:MAG TPA: hypothetical protein VE988_00730 [Gemmataceae bacterium]|nr:hypothetical protein [Gemmataceae bacterium]
MKDRALPAEMARPLLTPRIEQPSSFVGLRVDPCQVRTFVVVIRQASKSQVRGRGFATMLFGNDVIKLESR